ncbi:hypothetical protein E4U17_005919 [Claviceps sp. LM77 group G4]|nr:hypothetical protein E4U17_005919 [Claviceps sp. LM77 group G4]
MLADLTRELQESRQRIEESRQRIEESRQRIEESRQRIEESRQRAEELRQRAEEAEAWWDHERGPLNVQDFLKECHDADIPVRVVTDPNEVTQGPPVDAERRKRPRLIRWSQELGQEQLHILNSLPWNHIVSSDGGSATRSWLGQLKRQVPPIDSEITLNLRQEFIVISPLRTLIQDFQRDAELTDHYRLHGHLKIREHMNGVRTATNPSKSASQTQERHNWGDIFCSFQKEPTENPENGDFVWMAERKPPAKVQETVVQLALPNSQCEIDLNRCSSGGESEEKTLIAKIITQLFSSMLKKGLCYGVVDTGECMIYVRIDSRDPSMVEYHLSCPGRDVNENGGDIRFSAVSQLFAFTVQAIRAPRPSEEWWAAIDKLSLWKDPRVNQNDIAPLGPPPHPNRPFDSYRDPFNTRAASRANRPADEVDDDEEASASVSEKRKTSSLGMHKRPDNRRKMQSDLVSRPYCTHECLRGLAFGGPLDKKCPNAGDHGSKHIDRQEFLHLMREQLNGEKAHANCKPINACGHIGHLFKICLLSHGYTLVSKAVGLGDGGILIHEEKMYNHLRDLQGHFIPVCPGRITLRAIFRSREYDFDVFRHFLFLSYAGQPVLKALSKVDDWVVSQVLDALAQLHQRGVMHRDAAPRNMLYDYRTGKYMVIDLELSEQIDGEVPEAVDFYMQKGKRKWEDDTESEPFATESKALLASLSSSIRAC